MNFSTLSRLASNKNQSFGLGKTFTTTMFLVIVMIILGQNSFAQVTLPHYDGLNYTVGQGLQAQTNWTVVNTGDDLLMTSGNLSYAGMPSSTGNKVTFDGAGIDGSKAFTQQTSGTVYFSFLINVTALGSLNTTGGYCAGFVEGATTNFGGTVWLRSDGAGYDIGINPRTTAANTVWSSGTTALNGTHLVVISYQIVASTANDVVKLWLDPVWGAAEPAATLTATNAGTDLANLNRILLRQDAASATPFVQMDEFRIGLNWQSVASTVNGTIAAAEYGTHTDGQNQNTNSGNVTYMNWDDNNLYVGVSGANIAEGYVLYLDKDPQIPVDGGTNANGTLIGQNYDGASFANLPWRADMVIYAKNGYREYRTATGSNTWTSANTSFGLYSDNGTVREFSIPWSVIGGRPASFNFFSYNVSAGGFVYNTQPTANAGGTIGASARYERYYTVSTTTVGSSTPPFSRNSFVFNNTADENGFGAISVYDFTMNTSGRFISRTGATGSNWSVAGSMVIGNGTVYFGSGGTNGAYGSTTVSGDLDIRGGTLDMDQTTSALTVNGNLSLTSGILKLSANSFGGGDLKLAGNWSRTSGTFTPQTRAVFFNGTAGNQTLAATSGSESFDFLIVDKSAGNLQLNTSVNVNAATSNKFQIINTGGVDLNGNQLVFNGSGGNIFVNGARTITSSLPNSVIQFNGLTSVTNNAGVGTLSIGGNIKNELNGIIDFGNSITIIHGILELEVNEALSYVSNNSPIYGVGSTLAYKVDHVSPGIGLEWPTLNGPTNVTVYNGSNQVLTGNRSVLGSVQLNGYITTNSNTLTVFSSGTIAPFNTGGWVRGNLQRSVATGTNTYLFPLGNNFRYTPASIAFSGVTNAGDLTMSIDGTNYPPQLDASKRVNIIWKAINSGISGFTYDATFTYDNTLLGGGATQALLKPYKFDAPSTYSFPAHSIGSFSFTETGLTSFSEFGAGECGVIPVDPITGGGASICIGATQQLASTTPGGVWSSDAPLTASVNGTGLVTGNAAGTTTIRYTVTEPLSGCTGEATQSVTVLPNYTITASAGSGGSISPNGVTTLCEGANQTYTITAADACHAISDVVVDGVSQGAIGTYTFTNVTANHTISATFSLITYTITVTAGSNGSITPATGSVNCGDNATYTITADACYSIADVVVDGVSQGAVGTYTFTNVTANHTISATFSLNTYTITVTAGANGSITPATGSVNCGDNATYTITADACYSIADVVVDGVSQGAVGTYTFTNVTAAHTISATFSLNTYTITVTAGANGSITPATGSVNCGDNATYTITADACYSIADVVVDGVSQGAVGTYTFTNVTAAHTISATFSLNTYTITVTAGANGSITPATGSVNCGDNATYTINADACYSIADVVVDGVSQGAVGTYTFTNVTANHTISATFSLNTYTITVTAGANGSITPATGSVNCGDNATYTITAYACYSIADVVVDGVSQGAVGTYTFTNVTANHTISATFSLNTYTITVTSGANGSITPATGSVNCGDNATYTITADACYSIADVVVDGVSQGAVGTYTFTNVTAAHTISATFSLNTYTITVTSGANGSITPATGSVNCGDNATYTITADACYSIADVVVDGVSQGAVGTYTFTNVTANHTISATFSLNTYTITVTSGANGSITPATGSVNCGDNATYTITADACYSIADVVVDGVSQGAVGTYTFTNVTANHTISATFALATYTITVTSGANGSITPATGSVNCGDNATYTITADACYSIADVVVDGVSQGAVGTYTFTNVTANHTISATFALSTYTITVTSGANGSITPATGSVNCGGNATYTITADACYSIADVVVDGVSQGAVGTYTFTNVTTNHTISAIFALTTYTITVTAGANGSITPATGSVNCGDNATYTITADACYAIADVVVDGVSQGAVGTYTFTNVTANHTISATFIATTYTITVTAGANGSITPATGSVNCGDNATYTIAADACYSIADVVVDGVSQGAVGTYTFTNVTANHTISATFSLNTYTITVTAGANGSITPATGSVNCGDNATYTITPNACYAIADVIVDGVSQGAVGTYTFTNVTANHTISATFVATTYTITVTAGANGSITPATGSVNCGDNATYTITANACYSIADVVVDGVSQGAVGTYTFTNVTANHTISATFIVNTFTITVTAGANGSITPATGSVNCGANATYTITPNVCYHVVDVIVDGVSQGAITTYTFTNVTANHTISASFAINAALTVSVSGPVNVCPYIGTGDQVVYTATSAGATGFTWVTPPNVTVISGAGTSTLTVTFQNGFLAQGNKQLKVTALSPCGNSSQFIYYLVAQAPGTPQPIVASSSNVCAVIGTPGTITYTINSVIGATSYNWTAPANTTINHPNGAGTINDTTVTLSFSNLFTGGNISVVASNAGCGSGGTRSLAITRSNPSTPGLINGPTNVCAHIAPGGTAATYSVAPVANASSYNWVAPVGSIVTHPNGAGVNDYTITVVFPVGFTSGSVTVSASNGCGTSGVRSLSLTKLNPATPSVIDVINTVSCPNREFTYTIASMPANATSLVWTAPAGGTIISGQNTISITVSYAPTAINGNVTVQSFNNCGSSTIRVSVVKLPSCPGERLIAKGGSETTTPAQTMQVNVFPNPTVSDFKLQVTAAGKEMIRVRIMDMQGREYKNFTVLPNQTTNIGTDLKAGAYMMEVRQGAVTKTTKLLKF